MKQPSSWRSSFEAATLASLLLLLGPSPPIPVAAAAAAVTATATTAPAGTAAATALACDRLEVDGHAYNLQPLAGPHSVVTHEYTRPTYHNTTYTIDLCGPLRRKGDVPAEERCPDGTRVCAIKHRWDPKEGKVVGTDQVIPIVRGSGDDNKAVAWEAKRLPADESTQKDAKREGLRLTLQGGTYQQRAQRTVVEFRCNPDLAGTEGEWESVDEYVTAKEGDGKANSRREEKGDSGKGDSSKKDEEDDSTPEQQLKKDGAALVWEGYKREKDGSGADMDTLYLTWYTKQACDAAVDQPPPPPPQQSKHWGFFTWLVILVFLAIASYLIFGSWLNYNRYGARGWDLLPHGDTLRDIPYLMKDLIRRVLNTLQSTGSRGGYSAV
ncbi:f0aebb9f-fe66-4fb9-8423-0b932b7a3669 [Thermothielavioides terrestris]|uniref:Autophagy-related protein 27 n=2 Tax=Thermothielavioides terrestris TaxID=2587410 RepID=G2RGP7_THETT|nr:uncharacterized protein THITE_2123089 [Thermothielavioides terrestris NRRL 8126]AEO71079.1 hypothetical protein THITE_2123089 [Thermothielavioides terrestris NRRL 8126]SPQ20575.1 f0aebb9f-fe66-4fb9-8423-0b932b7a3669 [Thermothielavioides terrestris]